MNDLFNSFSDELEKISGVGGMALAGGGLGATLGALVGGAAGALRAKKRKKNALKAALRGAGFGALVGGATGALGSALSGGLMNRASTKTLDYLMNVKGSPVSVDSINKARRAFGGASFAETAGLLAAIPAGGYIGYKKSLE